MNKPITSNKFASDLWGMMQMAIDEAVLAERQWLIDSGLIGVLKHCEDLLREDGHEDAVDDVQSMIAKIKSRVKVQ
jgi:hypothetical protein